MRLPNGDCDFGWVAALAVERAAALAVLDEEYEVLPQAMGDTNSYSFGRIGRHNIVIASLPLDGYGTINAATVANNMHRTFPSLRGCLVVGLAGGTGSADVRLGDIVVSDKVVQYDIGKDTPEGFTTKSIPLRPSPLLLNAVQALKARHLTRPPKIPSIVIQIAKDRPRMKITSREALEDCLFRGTYKHSGPEDSCIGCDKSELVERPLRQDNDPQIHYGVVASGNSLIRSAEKRNRLAEQHGALCFEMEGAGVIEAHQCLVICSICDYADSHKNKQWQPYAAAVAAAYVKELLSEIASQIVSDPDIIAKDEILQLKEALMNSLFFQSNRSRMVGIEPADPNTCNWILHHPDYVVWRNPEMQPQSSGLFWIRGKPGAGKSTLTKFVYEQLKRQHNAISFFFSARGDNLGKSVEGMYRSLLYQLLEMLPDLQHVLEDTYLLRMASTGCIKWDIGTLRDTFQNAVLKLGQETLICFIDALDECNKFEVEKLVSYFKRLGSIASNKKVLLFTWVSSRHYPTIPKITNLTLILEDQIGHRRDLEKYVDNNLDIGNEDDAQKIRTRLIRKAAGVFLWVTLAVSILNKECRDGRLFAIEEKLDEIPTGLSDLFRDIIRKDTTNMPEFLLSIQWIMYAREPLNVKQYYYAIVAGLSPDKLAAWDPDRVTRDDMRRFVSSSSKGLAEATWSDNVQFIHESVPDFLLRDGGIGEVWPRLGGGFQYWGHNALKKCCYAYIIALSSNTNHLGRRFVECLKPPGDGFMPKAWKTASEDLDGRVGQSLPFLRYATKYVLHHANIAAAGLPQDIFLKSFDVRSWARLYNKLVRRHSGLIYKSEMPPNMLYAFAELDYSQLISTVVRDDPVIHVYEEEFEYPLFAALHLGHRKAVDALLQIGEFQADTESTLRHTPVTRAIKERHKRVVEMLLNNGADLDLRHTNSETPLLYATYLLYLEMVKLLLDKGAQTDLRNNSGETPLLRATRLGNEAIAKHLSAGAHVNVYDNTGMTPLLFASKHGTRETVKILLDWGAQLDVSNIDGMTPLLFAIEHGSGEIMKLLLDRGSKLDISDGDGMTPLLFAAKHGSKETVKILLNRGAKLDMDCGFASGQRR
ncbi:hypothetical protein GGR51DRAFT_568369 [Nemania sp. FL0031]|nr:hypothetical protein GGR51DRAFT_568369 [Nemania sp. FL0031]